MGELSSVVLVLKTTFFSQQKASHTTKECLHSNKAVHLLEMLGNTCTQEAVHTGLDTSVHFPSVPKLVHGECTSLETLGNCKLYCCVGPFIPVFFANLYLAQLAVFTYTEDISCEVTSTVTVCSSSCSSVTTITVVLHHNLAEPSKALK